MGGSDKTPPTQALIWDNLIQIAANSSILTSLQQSSAKMPLGIQPPEEIATLLSTVHTLNTERNRIALAQAQEFAAALNDVAIQPVALKGLANIIVGIYPDLGSRYLADIDLLVPTHQFPAAVAIFQNLGYSTEPTHPVELAIGHSYPPLTRAHSLEIDLHRSMGLGICASFLPTSEIICRSTVYHLGGAAIRIPSPEALRPTTSCTPKCMTITANASIHLFARSMISSSFTDISEVVSTGRLIESNFHAKGPIRDIRVISPPAGSIHWALNPPAAVHMSPVLRLRRCRRELLQRLPAVAFSRPVYYFLAGVRPRTGGSAKSFRSAVD